MEKRIVVIASCGERTFSTSFRFVWPDMLTKGQIKKAISRKIKARVLKIGVYAL